MKTVMLVDDGGGDGRQSIVLGTFESPNSDAVRELLNLKGNAETSDEIKITFEEWTDEQIWKSEIAGQIWAGEQLTPQQRRDWVRLGGDESALPNEDL